MRATLDASEASFKNSFINNLYQESKTTHRVLSENITRDYRNLYKFGMFFEKQIFVYVKQTKKFIKFFIQKNQKGEMRLFERDTRQISKWALISKDEPEKGDDVPEEEDENDQSKTYKILYIVAMALLLLCLLLFIFTKKRKFTKSNSATTIKSQTISLKANSSVDKGKSNTDKISKSYVSCSEKVLLKLHSGGAGQSREQISNRGQTSKYCSTTGASTGSSIGRSVFSTNSMPYSKANSNIIQGSGGPGSVLSLASNSVQLSKVPSAYESEVRSVESKQASSSQVTKANFVPSTDEFEIVSRIRKK